MPRTGARRDRRCPMPHRAPQGAVHALDQHVADDQVRFDPAWRRTPQRRGMDAAMDAGIHI